MAYNYYAELVRRIRYGGELQKAEIRSDWPAFAPALVLTFRFGEERAIRHTMWDWFLKETYVRKAMEPEQYGWAVQLAQRARM